MTDIVENIDFENEVLSLLKLLIDEQRLTNHILQDVHDLEITVDEIEREVE